jgi:hypothetical protein
VAAADIAQLSFQPVLFNLVADFFRYCKAEPGNPIRLFDKFQRQVAATHRSAFLVHILKISQAVCAR